jgi:hypothetical protein
VTGVVGIVAIVPCRSMGVMANVTSGVRPSCVGSLAPRWRLGRGGVCARPPEGSGEAEPASEVKGSGETEFAPEAKGSGETELAPEPKYSHVLALSLFCDFYSPDLGILFMVPNTTHPPCTGSPLSGPAH